MPINPVSDDNDISSALNIARQSTGADLIQDKIGGLNQFLTGLDLEANTPQFNTGIGGAGMPSGMPSNILPNQPSNISNQPITRSGADILRKDPALAANPPIMSERGLPFHELEYTYVPKNNLQPWKEITPEELYKERAFVTPAVGDRTSANVLIQSILENKLNQPVNTLGGMDFQRYDPAAWASRDAAVKGMMTRIGKQEIPEDRPLYMSGTLMGLPASDSSHMMAQSLLRQIDPSKLDQSGIDAVNKFMGSKIKDWPGIENPRAVEELLQRNNVGTETSLLSKALDKAIPHKAGFPDVGAARFAITDPRLFSPEQLATGYSMSKIDLSKQPYQDDNSHLTYPTKIPSVSGYEGGLKYQVPAEVMFPDWAKNQLTVDKNGNLITPTNKQQALMTQMPVQEANQQWLDNFMRHQEQHKKVWGYRKGGRTLGNNAIDNALRLATGGRAHFDDGGDAGAAVRGGDNPGGYSGDTGRFSGNQDAANNFRMGDSPGGFGGDTGSYSSHDVGAEQGAINAQTARDQQNQQNERQAQQNNPEGYSVRTNDVPGGLGGDTGRYNGPTNQAEAQQNFAAVVLQGNIQRARQQQQQAFDKYMNQIQGPESGGQGSAYNATTGAFGAYQLMPSTALGLMQKYAPGETYRQALGTSNPADVAAGGLNAGPGYVGLTPQEQLRDITLNQDLQRTLAEGLTRDNMATLSSAGVPINSGSLYTAHLLGAGDALKVLQSDPNTPLSETGINPQAISNNKLEGMTAGQLLARSGSQMAATPASGVSSAGGYGRLAENVTDNSGARITDATENPDAAVTAAKAAATAQQPSIFDKIFGSTQDQIDKLAAQGQYSGMDKQQYADEFANGDPNAVKERIIYDNGQPKVDYYTKDLSQALFGDPLKALQTGISGLFKPSTSDNGFRSSVTQPTDNAAPTYGGHGGQQAINQAIAVAQPQQVAAPAPYIAQLGNYNSQLPSTTGQTAEQWAAANTGGDMSRVNGRIKYVNGAPMLEFYSA